MFYVDFWQKILTFPDLFSAASGLSGSIDAPKFPQNTVKRTGNTPKCSQNIEKNTEFQAQENVPLRNPFYYLVWFKFQDGLSSVRGFLFTPAGTGTQSSRTPLLEESVIC